MKKKCLDCDGEVEISAENSVQVQTGCSSTSPAYPCNKCRRLYFFGSGVLGYVMNRAEPKKRVLLSKSGEHLEIVN